MLSDKEFTKIIYKIKISGQHLTLGYLISEAQFAIIAETSAKHIIRYGWDWYINQMELWRMRIIHKL